MSETTLDKIVSLCKRRGFIFQSSEIYGGLAGSWDYGPLGVELKNNIRDFWWKEMTQLHDNSRARCRFLCPRLGEWSR